MSSFPTGRRRSLLKCTPGYDGVVRVLHLLGHRGALIIDFLDLSSQLIPPTTLFTAESGTILPQYQCKIKRGSSPLVHKQILWGMSQGY